MDKYYLQINLISKNNKKILTNYELYNNDKLIKIYDDNDTKKISKIIKDYKKAYKLDIDKSEKNYKIYDYNFLKNYIGIPSKNVIHKSKYVKEIAILSTLAIGFIGTSIYDHKINPDLYNNSNIESNNNDIDNEIDFVYVDKNKEITTESTTDDINKDIDTPIVYYPEDKKKENYELKIFSDDDDNIIQNILPTEMVSSSEDIYTRNIECEDVSNDDLLLFIQRTYKIPII